MATSENQPLLTRQNSRQAQPTYGRQSSWHFVPREDSWEVKNGAVPSSVRNDFIKKVYGILCAQLLVTAIIAAMFVYLPPLRDGSVMFVKSSPVLFTVLLYSTMIPTICALMCFKNNYPTNFVLCWLFVFIMGCYVGVVCALYYVAGSGSAIVTSIIVTAVIFLALTAYCHISKTDFTYMGGFLFCSLFGISFGFDCYLYEVALPHVHLPGVWSVGIHRIYPL